ncbi:MAG: hypothetical protein KGL74_01185 [Elusimicrobia bacterium]|nr:hypothetical protein [Elusimicrobiota bacterium]
MKIFRWSAVALTAAAMFSIGCSSGGCGGTNLNSNNTNTPTVSCGPGTSQQNGVCVPITGTSTH